MPAQPEAPAAPCCTRRARDNGGLLTALMAQAAVAVVARLEVLEISPGQDPDMAAVALVSVLQIPVRKLLDCGEAAADQFPALIMVTVPAEVLRLFQFGDIPDLRVEPVAVLAAPVVADY